MGDYDGFVRVQADSTSGKRVDTSEIVNDDGLTIERQRVAISDSENPNLHLRLTGKAEEGKIYVLDKELSEKMDSLLSTMQRIEKLLEEMLK